MPVITFHGHACCEIESDGHRIVIDPFLTGNPKADISEHELTDISAVLVTHGHGDHLGDAIPICQRTGAQLVATFELAMFCSDQGVENVHPMHIGGQWCFEWGSVKLVSAIHGGMVEGDTGRYTTIPAGIVVTMGGTSIYHAGDTALTLDMQLLAGQVDVMLCPIGDNFTMGIDDATRAVDFVKPTTVIPIHYGTFDLIAVNPQAFADRVGSRATVAILEPGQSLKV